MMKRFCDIKPGEYFKTSQESKDLWMKIAVNKEENTCICMQCSGSNFATHPCNANDEKEYYLCNEEGDLLDDLIWEDLP